MMAILATPRRRSTFVWPMLLIALLGGAAWHELAPGRVPTGQTALTTVSPSSLDAIKDEFNRNADRVRLVLLLSPT